MLTTQRPSKSRLGRSAGRSRQVASGNAHDGTADLPYWRFDRRPRAIKWTVYDLMKKVTFPDPFNLR